VDAVEQRGLPADELRHLRKARVGSLLLGGFQQCSCPRVLYTESSVRSKMRESSARTKMRESSARSKMRKHLASLQSVQEEEEFQEREFLLCNEATQSANCQVAGLVLQQICCHV